MKPEELTAIRKLVMGRAWQLIHESGLDRKAARRQATSEVADAVHMTAQEINKLWCDDMAVRRFQSTIKDIPGSTPGSRAVFTKGVFVDDDEPQFYDDYQDDTPKEKLLWITEQLRGMKVDQARACLFDTQGEADLHKKNVPAAARALGWKSNRRNRGYYAEIIPVASKFKLRVKRLR